MNGRTPVLLAFMFFFISCGPEQSSPEAPQARLSATIEPGDIRTHIQFLASDSLRGRATGTAGEAIAANYIADAFNQFGIAPLGEDDTYFQPFTVTTDHLHNPPQGDTSRQRERPLLSRNVVGIINGSEEPDSYMIIGAHYDHLGTGGYGSLANRRRNQIHNGADDNASGTAGILELAQYFSVNSPRKSLVFVAFSGEEIGLLGSQHFVDQLPVPAEQVEAMINLDMIGRLQDNKLLIFGTGSAERWEQLIAEANTDSLQIETSADGTGASDHTSFYNKQIPVLHYFTGTHGDYHRPTDDAGQINYDGQDKVLEHVRRVIQQLDKPGSELTFTEVPASEQQKGISMKGVTLGVTPDYGFDGTGMRITGVNAGGPAGRAGLRSGDVIIKLDGQPLKDIYEYMEILGGLEEGETGTVTVQRGEEELTLDIRF
ncbi:M28 family peptidase [Halalkalibaculum sp. DA3122]|uniref:M28 family peptidase n=1 Tax=Halalkalibaculum sp. DA3122 TaxID=3373607 RepID=UPI003755410E